MILWTRIITFSWVWSCSPIMHLASWLYCNSLRNSLFNFLMFLFFYRTPDSEPCSRRFEFVLEGLRCSQLGLFNVVLGWSYTQIPGGLQRFLSSIVYLFFCFLFVETRSLFVFQTFALDNLLTLWNCTDIWNELYCTRCFEVVLEPGN